MIAGRIGITTPDRREGVIIIKQPVVLVLITRFIKFIVLFPFRVAEWIALQLNFILPIPLQIAAQIGAIAFVMGIILSPLYVVALPIYKVIMIGTVIYGLYKGTNLTGGSDFKFNKPRTSGLHGKQQMATIKDLRVSNLVNPEPSLVLGRQNKKMIGPAQGAEWHALMVGGAGTGKTSAGIIPTIRNFNGSVICLDIKGDIYNATHAQRAGMGPIIRINPLSADTWRYNPLSACMLDNLGIVEAMELARALVPDPPPGGGNEGWIVAGARGLLAALSLIYGAQMATLPELARLIVTANPTQLAALIQASGDDIIKSYASQYLNNISNANIAGYMPAKIAEFLTTFSTDSDIQRVLTPERGKDFDFAVMDETVTVYLQVPEHKLKQYSDLWRLIFMQLLRHAQQRGENKQPHMLISIDEFPQLGKMDNLPEMFATLRSRNVHMLLAGQSIADIDSKYDPLTRRRIVDNCNYISVFSATDPEGQRYFSDLTGQQTVRTESGGISENRQKLALPGQGGTGKNLSWSEKGEPLIRPEEFRDLGDDVIVIPRTTYPMRLGKAFYFKD